MGSVQSLRRTNQLVRKKGNNPWKDLPQQPKKPAHFQGLVFVYNRQKLLHLSGSNSVKTYLEPVTALFTAFEAR